MTRDVGPSQSSPSVDNTCRCLMVYTQASSTHSRLFTLGERDQSDASRRSPLFMKLTCHVRLCFEAEMTDRKSNKKSLQITRGCPQWHEKWPYCWRNSWPKTQNQNDCFVFCRKWLSSGVFGTTLATFVIILIYIIYRRWMGNGVFQLRLG